MTKKRYRTGGVTALAVAASLALVAGCGSDPEPSASQEQSSEVGSPRPRVTLTYDGGLLVLDAATLEVEADIPVDGFTRVNPAGDGRHVLVTTEQGFEVLDTGVWTEGGMSRAIEPELTDLVFEAKAAGHVVRHADRTMLFADGTGETTIFDTDDLLKAEGELPETEVVPAPEAHHGVSIELEDGTLLTTVGDEEARTGIRVLDAERKEIATSDQCPSVHGEGTAADEVVVFGCENGLLMYDDGVITKVPSPDAYGRIGNAYVTETSPIAVVDYNDDPDAEGYTLNKLGFVDTATKKLEIIDLPAGVEYTWRDVARGPSDEVLLLGTDGSLHVLDPETRKVTASYPVIDAWEGPAEWQDPHPALVVQDGTAFVTEPTAKKVHAVDIATGKVVATADLEQVPNEIALVTG